MFWALPLIEAWVRLITVMSGCSRRNFAARFKEQKWPLNVLVNNAGANYKKRWFTPEGIVGLCQVGLICPAVQMRLLT